MLNHLELLPKFLHLLFFATHRYIVRIVFKQTALALAEQRLISRIVKGLCELRLRLEHDFLEGTQLIDDFCVRG